MCTSKELNLNWQLQNEGCSTIEKYCSHCGKTVSFRDSGYRRQNANGKTIFHFAIYKCDKGHTWNKKLEVFTAKSNLVNVPVFVEDQLHEKELSIQEETALLLADVKAAGYERIAIHVTVCGDKQRLDKVLADQIADCSRTKLARLIELGQVLLDGQVVKAKTCLSNQHRITIVLEGL